MSEVIRTMGDTEGSMWTQHHTYESYAPQRMNVPAQWLVYVCYEL